MSALAWRVGVVDLLASKNVFLKECDIPVRIRIRIRI